MSLSSWLRSEMHQVIKSNSVSSFWSSQDVCLEHGGREVHGGYFHLEQAWKKPEGSYPSPPYLPLCPNLPLIAQVPLLTWLFSSRVCGELFSPANVATYVG